MYKFLILILLFFFKTNILLSEIVNNIEVKGNKRVSEKTIINFSKIKIGNDYSEKKLNESLKKLYDTDFFENVELKLQEDNFSISVVEAPLIDTDRSIGSKADK